MNTDRILQIVENNNPPTIMKDWKGKNRYAKWCNKCNSYVLGEEVRDISHRGDRKK